MVKFGQMSPTLSPDFAFCMQLVLLQLGQAFCCQKGADSADAEQCLKLDPMPHR
jgi:hypothetical protein